MVSNRFSILQLISLVGILGLTIQSTDLPAQKRINGLRPITPEQIIRIRSLDSLRMSPDGRHVAFTVKEPIKGRVPNQNIWRLDVETRQVRRLTTSRKVDGQPQWSPDGRTLAFLSNRSGSQQIYLMPVDGGEAEQLMEFESGIEGYAWSPDGKQIAFVAPEPKTEKDKKREDKWGDARVVGREIYSSHKRSQFWIVDVESRKVRQLSKGDWRFSNGDATSSFFAWGPQGKRLFISATSDRRVAVFTSRIYTLRLRDGKMEEFAAPRGTFGHMSVSPDGKTFAYLGAREDGPQIEDLYIRPIGRGGGGPARNLTGSTIDRRLKSYEWRPDGTLVVLAETGFAATFYQCSLDGEVKQLKAFEVPPVSHWGNSKPFAVSSSRLVFAAEASTRPPELWMSTRGEDATQVTQLNREWEHFRKLPIEIFRYRSFDGLEIEAGLLKPVGYEEGHRYPLVVLVHGGPTAHWVDRIEKWGQPLAARGFAVLYPNIRGSTGYGYGFTSKVRMDVGGADFKDVMSGVDHLIEKGIADPDRLGIGGWSYGGYMSAWAVTQTNRFKAAVSGAPMTNLISEFGTEESWLNFYDAWNFGTPYEHWDLLADRSPVKHVMKVETPTLILLGESDITDPIGQCFEFHRGLLNHGVETKLVLYPRVGHSSTIPEEKHRLDMIHRFIDWFEKHL